MRRLLSFAAAAVLGVAVAGSPAFASTPETEIRPAIADVGQVVDLNIDSDVDLERFTLLAAPDGVGIQWTLQDGAAAPTSIGPLADFLAVPMVLDVNTDGRPEFLIAGGGGSLGLYIYEVWQWNGDTARLAWQWNDARDVGAARGANVSFARLLVATSRQAIVTETTAASGCRGCPADLRIRATFTYRASTDTWRFARLDRSPIYRAGRRRCRDVRLGPVQYIVEIRASAVSCFAARVMLDKADLVRRGRRSWTSDGVAWRFRFEDEVSGRLTGVRGPQRLSGLRVTT